MQVMNIIQTTRTKLCIFVKTKKLSTNFATSLLKIVILQIWLYYTKDPNPFLSLHKSNLIIVAIIMRKPYKS